MSRKPQLSCSFCGKTKSQVKTLIAGPENNHICNDCVEVCSDIINQDKLVVDTGGTSKQKYNLLTPKEILVKLNEYVIGQQYAKKILSVAVYNHYKRINANSNRLASDEVELDKSNVLLIGPTGCGKTLLAKTLARILDVPFAIVDATTLTEAGYVGDDVETIINKLIQAADYDVAKAEQGIIYVDEIDKISRKSESASITRDVSGEGVQQALLKLIEGTEATVPPQGGRKHPQQELLRINTSNILFICSGAFAGLDTIIQNRSQETGIGFKAQVKTQQLEQDNYQLLRKVEPEDLIKYGLIPEFIGRLPIEVALQQLDEYALIRILTEPKNALVKQYQKIFALDDVNLEFTNSALVAIVKKAMQRKTGARGLRSVIEIALLELMFEIPDLANKLDLEKIIIDANFITNQSKPVYVYNNQISAV